MCKDVLNIRSLLFTPANRPEKFEKALTSQADLIIFDLEDAVAPPDKELARNTFKNHFLGAASNKRYGVRINSIKTTEGLKDLLMLSTLTMLPKVLMIPKLESPEELAIIVATIPNADKLQLIGLIETANALLNLQRILQPNTLLSSIMLGAADLTSDLNAANTPEFLFPIRSQLVIAAAQQGITLIDSPFFDISDDEGLYKETIQVQMMGFSAKAAIHPNQLKTINEVFSPDDQALADAREIIKIAATGVGVYKGKMVDNAMAIRAKKVIEKHNIIQQNK